MNDFLMDNFIEQKKCKRLRLDKRKYIEISTPCIARFRVKQYEGQEMSSSEWNIVAVKDLSAGGIMFNYYKMNLGFGSVLELKIDFIKSKPSINCIGRVINIDDAHVNSMFHISTEFLEINEQDRDLINTSVEAILKREAQKNKRIYPKMRTKITSIGEILKREVQKNKRIYPKMHTKITSVGTIIKREVKIKNKVYSRKNKRACSGIQAKIKNTLANTKPLRIILHGW